MYQNPLDRRVLYKLEKLYRRTKIDLDGEPWTALQLDRYADELGVTKAGISLSMKRLERDGFIEKRYQRWGRSTRLYARPAKREIDVNPPESEREIDVKLTCYIETEKPIKLEEPKKPMASPEGSANSAEKNMTREIRKKNLTGSLPETVDTTPPPPSTPSQWAAHWSRELKKHSGETFRVEPKSIRHVNLVMERLKGTGFDLTDLDLILDHYPHYRVKDAGKLCEPWCFLRSVDQFLQRMDDILDMQEAAKLMVDEQKSSGPVAQSVQNKPQQTPSRFLTMFAKGKNGTSGE